MSILSYTEICELLAAGVVEGSDVAHVNSASLDVHLGPDFLFEAVPAAHRPYVDLALRETVAFYRKPGYTPADKSDTARIEREAGVPRYYLTPGEFVLAATREKFNLPNDISAEFRLKSSIARNGLEQLSAVWADAGWHGSALTLELFNVTRYHTLKLSEGLAVGQMIFHRHTAVPDHASYAARGRYNNDPGVQPIKP